MREPLPIPSDPVVTSGESLKRLLFQEFVAVRLLWLKVYAPVVETNSRAPSGGWNAHDPGNADGAFADEGDTVVDGAVPVRQRDWAVRAAPRRVAPWTAAAARSPGATSTSR